MFLFQEKKLKKPTISNACNDLESNDENKIGCYYRVVGTLSIEGLYFAMPDSAIRQPGGRINWRKSASLVCGWTKNMGGLLLSEPWTSHF